MVTGQPAGGRGRVPLRWDLLSLTSASLALAMAGVYVRVINAQGDSPVAWYLTALLAGAALSLYGVRRNQPHRVAALAVAAYVLVILGMLGAASIGLPILVAGVLAGIATVRALQPAGRDPRKRG